MIFRNKELEKVIEQLELSNSRLISEVNFLKEQLKSAESRVDKVNDLLYKKLGLIKQEVPVNSSQENIGPIPRRRQFKDVRDELERKHAKDYWASKKDEIKVDTAISDNDSTNASSELPERLS